VKNSFGTPKIGEEDRQTAESGFAAFPPGEKKPG